ncbi:MAG: DUF4399 domain-containing protein [Thermoanaerobaculia bacterium]
MVTRKLLQSRTTILMALLALTSGAFLACGGGAGDQETVDAGHADAEPGGEMMAAADEGAPRVFFTNLADGDEVVSPVQLEFGTENYEIVPAQDPVVIEEGKGHHHLGVNTDCKPAGEVIEKAQPWIHFGDGSNSIDMQLPPGPATLTLQIGDGEHRTLDIEGLCHTITVTVVEGEASE